jgi:site-specific DNA recombinase
MIGLSRSALGQVRPATPDQREDVQFLEDALAAAHRELDALRGQRIDADDLRAALASFTPVWDHLTSHERARVVQLLIERIDYDGGTGKIGITFAPAGVRMLATEARA